MFDTPSITIATPETVYLFRIWTGPTAVTAVGNRFAEAGYFVEAYGAEHVYIRARGVDADIASYRMLKGFREKHGTDFGMRPVKWATLPAGSAS